MVREGTLVLTPDIHPLAGEGVWSALAHLASTWAALLGIRFDVRQKCFYSTAYRQAPLPRCRC